MATFKNIPDGKERRRNSIFWILHKIMEFVSGLMFINATSSIMLYMYNFVLNLFSVYYDDDNDGDDDDSDNDDDGDDDGDDDDSDDDDDDDGDGDGDGDGDDDDSDDDDDDDDDDGDGDGDGDVAFCQSW